MRIPKRALVALAVLTGAALLAAGPGAAFCGFYVAMADAKLFNKASKVVVARKDGRTAVTMASDYRGDLKEFALAIPVPAVVTREQIAIVDSATVDHLDSYSAPRLVEYFVERFGQLSPLAPSGQRLRWQTAITDQPPGWPATARSPCFTLFPRSRRCIGSFSRSFRRASQVDTRKVAILPARVTANLLVVNTVERLASSPCL